MPAPEHDALGAGRALSLLDALLKDPPADRVEVSLVRRSGGYARCARSRIHQSAEETSLSISVRAALGRKVGAASTNRLTPEALRGALEDAVRAARVSPEAEHLGPMAEPWDAPGGPADDSDLELGDVIISYDGERVQDIEDLQQKVVETRPGTVVDLGVYRNGSPTNLPVRIGELDLDNEGQVAPEVVVENLDTGFGMSLQDLTAESIRELRLPRGTYGALVTNVDPGGAALLGNVRPNDVITAVNRVPVATAADAIRELNQVESGRTAFLLVVRGNEERFLRLRKE